MHHIKVTAERDYKPIFTEAFYSTENPLGVHLIDRKVINGEKPGKPASERVLSNLIELISRGIKTDGKAYTQSKIDLKSQIKDLPIIEKFQEIIGYEFDWSKFRNRRELRCILELGKQVMNMEENLTLEIVEERLKELAKEHNLDLMNERVLVLYSQKYSGMTNEIADILSPRYGFIGDYPIQKENTF